MGRLAVAVVCALAAGALLVGCGGTDDAGGEGSDSVEKPVTKKQFSAQADAVCERHNDLIAKDLEAFQKKNGLGENDPLTPQQSKELTRTILIPRIKDEAEKLRALEAPPGDQAEYTALLDALDAGVAKAEKDPEALLDSKKDPLDPASRKAQAYGFEVCGQAAG